MNSSGVGDIPQLGPGCRIDGSGNGQGGAGKNGFEIGDVQLETVKAVPGAWFLAPIS